MGDALTTVTVIMLAAVLLFLYPMMTMADRTDDISQVAVQIATTSFVDEVRKTGKLTDENYKNYELKLGATGNTYRIELQIQRLDINPSKKLAYEAITKTEAESTKMGSTYYSLYTYQIDKMLQESVEESSENKGVIYLKKGDVFSVSVANTSQTVAASMKNFIYKMTGNSFYNVSAEHTGVVLTTGQ